MIHVDAQTMREIAPHFSGANGERQNTASSRRSVKCSPRPWSLTRSAPGCGSPTFSGRPATNRRDFRTTEESSPVGGLLKGARTWATTGLATACVQGARALQLTGRANYRAFGNLLGVALEDNPELAAEPVLSLRIACEFWKKKT